MKFCENVSSVVLVSMVYDAIDLEYFEEVMTCEVKNSLLPSEFVSPIFERV